MVEVQGLVRKFKKRKGFLKTELSTALDLLTFTVEPAQGLGIVGPYGAGKSVLIRLLSRKLAPTAGQIKRGHWSLVLEQPGEFRGKLNAWENLSFYGILLGFSHAQAHTRIDQVLPNASKDREIGDMET